jgi:hypothetical protein
MAPIYDPLVTTRWAERARSSPYYPALSHPVFRKVLPALATIALGLVTVAALVLGRRAG